MHFADSNLLAEYVFTSDIILIELFYEFFTKIAIITIIKCSKCEFQNKLDLLKKRRTFQVYDADLMVASPITLAM